MTMRSLIPKISLTINRISGDYIDGVYTLKTDTVFDVSANVQPYRGVSLQSDKDAKWQMASVILFTEDKIIVGDRFKYFNKNYEVKIVENYAGYQLSHFESIAHELEEELEKTT